MTTIHQQDSSASATIAGEPLIALGYKVLGQHQFSTRARRSARAGGDDGLSWRKVLPLFKCSESHELGASEFHRDTEPLPVSLIGTPHPPAAAFLCAAIADGHKLIEDFNGEEMVGAGNNQLTIRNGERMSFVKPVADHADLTVTTGALVHRVVIEGGRAVGVIEFAYADAEIMLSGGAIGSPKALLPSGIGPSAHGTCTMGRTDDPNAVVGADLRVRGIDGLRVADASIMPVLPAGSTNAPSITVGERASDLMLATSR